VLRCTSGQNSPTVLSRHHRMLLVGMFQTYATCVVYLCWVWGLNTGSAPRIHQGWCVKHAVIYRTGMGCKYTITTAVLVLRPGLCLWTEILTIKQSYVWILLFLVFECSTWVWMLHVYIFDMDSSSAEFVIDVIFTRQHYDGWRRRSPRWWGWAETRVAVAEKQVSQSSSLICDVVT